MEVEVTNDEHSDLFACVLDAFNTRIKITDEMLAAACLHPFQLFSEHIKAALNNKNISWQELLTNMIDKYGLLDENGDITEYLQSQEDSEQAQEVNN